MTARHRRRQLAIALVATVALAACGDDDESSTATTAASGGAATSAAAAGEGAEAEVQRAEEVVAPFLEPATSIDIDVPLTEKPREGIRVGWAEGNVDAMRVLTPGFEQATEAIGWELVTIGYDVADPQSANAALQQAVDQGVDYIALAGLGSASYESALANAKAAGIGMVQLDIAREPDAEAKGVIGCIACDEMVENWGRLMANWIIVDSGGSANVAYVTIPEFSSLIPEGRVFSETMAANCSACTAEDFETTIQSFSQGAIAGEVASYVQTHPDLDYLYFAFGQMAAGSREALDSAGIGQNVKIVTADPDLAGMQDIIDGKHSAGVNLAVEGHMWNAIDLMARHSLGMDLQPILDAAIPTQIYTQENIPQPAALYHGAEGYQDKFKALWQVA